MPVNHFSQPTAFHALNRNGRGTHGSCKLSNNTTLLGTPLLMTDKREGLVFAVSASADTLEVSRNFLFPISQAKTNARELQSLDQSMWSILRSDLRSTHMILLCKAKEEELTLRARAIMKVLLASLRGF